MLYEVITRFYQGQYVEHHAEGLRFNNKGRNPMKTSIFTEIKKRVLVLDGAMGTMIQRHKLEEEDYRGKRFANVPILQKGNNDSYNFV